ncbi:MAG: carbohydrate-binding module family 20 domain-containing protein [Acidobacteriota bacterium]
MTYPLRRVLVTATWAFALLALTAPLAAQTPLGATLVPGGVQFAVFSEHATRMEVSIFATPTASTPTSTHVLTKTDPVNHIWTATVTGAGAGTLYGLRAWGPNWTYTPGWTPGTPKASDPGFVTHVDASGNRFNPNKLLTDPYAKALTGEPVRVGSPEHYDSSILGGTAAYGFLDSAGAMPKSIVIDDAYDWSGDVKPQTDIEDTVVYEVHLRGFTRGDSSIAWADQGTYDGFAQKAGYLADLGITAVELLPIHEYPQFDDPVAPATEDRVNYWGYMTTNFFAPNREYLCRTYDPASSCTYTDGRQVTEFKDMVKALHDAGIEVWLDVVYNHTAEGGGCAGTPLKYFNLRGLDNQNYYTLADDKTCYWQSTGVGNNLNANRKAVRDLVIDSLTYWIDEMGVDGFRFDLAYTLGREGADGRIFNPNAQLLQQIAQLGVSKGVDMVAEAWDASGYGVGQFPQDWSEWNGFWRDNLRRYVKSDAGEVGTLGASITATHSGFGLPFESINFVTAHDGFTLNDLVTYNSKLNGVGACNPTGADPNSGNSNNDSWDTNGDETLRRQQIRNFASHLLLHYGVPMILAGDEFRNTQDGNNNGYMADNACGWLDWQDRIDHAWTHDYFRRMIHFRRAHEALTRTVHAAGHDHDGDGYKDLTWHGTTPDTPDWSAGSRSLAYLLDGSATETGGSADHPDLYVASNAYWGDLTFTLPTAPNGTCWYLLGDTASWLETQGNLLYEPSIASWNSQPLMRITGSTYGVAARSTLMLAARSCAAADVTLVTFEVNGYVTSMGQDMYVVGSAGELGGWNTDFAVPLQWIDSDTWRGVVAFDASQGASIDFKYIVRQGGAVTWEGGSNRTITVPSAGAGATSGTWQ